MGQQYLFYNGTVITMEEELYTEAALVEDGIIAGVGSFDTLLGRTAADVKKVDLNGGTLMPAFINPHSHFSAYASSLLQTTLDETVNFEEITEKIQDFIKKKQPSKGQWAMAKGYDHNTLVKYAHPSREVLGAAVPDNPVIIQHESGHVGVFSTAALGLLHMAEDTKAPDGRVIEKGDGKLVDYMEEAAFMKHLKEIPISPVKELMEAYEKTQKVYASRGIITIREGAMVDQVLPVHQGLIQSEMLKLDLVGYVDVNNGSELMRGFGENFREYRNRFRIDGCEIFLDGSPQGRTAWMRTSYVGNDDYCGYGTMTDEAVYEVIKYSLGENRQVLAHCNGDAASEQYLRAQGEAASDGIWNSDARPVMIHTQLAGVDQLPRVEKLRMIPSSFVAHVYHWGDVHMANFGKARADEISPTSSALKEGILFTFHQDALVIEPDMLGIIWCTVNRMARKGVPLGENERLPVLGALKAVTVNGAYQYFEEDKEGSTRKGKRTDLIIPGKNPLAIPPEEIRDIQVLETYKDGVQIFRPED